MTQAQMIKAAMKKKGLKPEEDAKVVADATGIHRTQVKRYIDGDCRVGGKNAPPLASYLDIDLGTLLSAAA